MERFLIVERDEPFRKQLQEQLEGLGYETSTVTDARQAIEILHTHPPNLVITDLQLPDSSGIDMLDRIRSEFPGTQVVVMTAFGSVEIAVAAMKAGAADFISKPFQRSQLQALITRVLGARRSLQGSLRGAATQPGFDQIIGSSRALLRVLDDASRVAPTDATVLIRGETGTGKELIARAIHYCSPRHNQAFVIVNCGAIPTELLESELFGYTKGSFTGAFMHKAGKVETADGGTLFLDEIGELPLGLQVRILRLIQEREIEKLGAETPIKVDVRIVAATHRDLEAMVANGSFREDLYYRLLVVPIEVPPLRERVHDITELVQHLFVKYKSRYGREDLNLPSELLPMFSNHHWPGNVRQLENAILRIVLLSEGTEVTRDDLPAFLAEEQPVSSVLSAELPDQGVSLEALEKELITRALAKCDGNQTRTARFLDMSRRTLGYRMHKFGLPSKVVKIHG